MSIAKVANKRTYVSNFAINISVVKIVYNILHIYISAISYKCSGFEKHKILHLLENLRAFKKKFINELYKFVTQNYYANFRLPFCHLVLGF